MRGELAVSLAGHDKGELYLIIREEGADVYLADGIYKTFASPKRKNRKHIQIVSTGFSPEEMSRLENNAANADTQIKRKIKLYRKAQL